ncbi:hypothetical protein AVEN_257916-1 [Araneus ventricosus]|uniref:Uncharacterized protein n=1 Tax=Araneus ventricosus TaxID=182803 RepID=A0A4Y2T6I3_ARAVE|nr:hypothetical protein AVEN_257916-1 [Araneus ventricosus]
MGLHKTGMISWDKGGWNATPVQQNHTAHILLVAAVVVPQKVLALTSTQNASHLKMSVKISQHDQNPPTEVAHPRDHLKPLNV